MWGGGGYFQGKGQGKILLCRGGDYMKNKNIGGCVLSLNLISKKAPMQKCAKMQKLSNIEKFFLARFAHSAFYKLHISGAANRHALVQYAIYVFFILFSRQSS